MHTTRFAHHRLDAFHVAKSALVAGRRARPQAPTRLRPPRRPDAARPTRRVSQSHRGGGARPRLIGASVSAAHAASATKRKPLSRRPSLSRSSARWKPTPYSQTSIGSRRCSPGSAASAPSRRSPAGATRCPPGSGARLRARPRLEARGSRLEARARGLAHAWLQIGTGPCPICQLSAPEERPDLNAAGRAPPDDARERRRSRPWRT